MFPRLSLLVAGYFSSWLSAILSAHFAHSVWFPSSYQEHGDVDPYNDGQYGSSDAQPLATAVGDDVLPTGVGGSAGQGAGGEEYAGYQSDQQEVALREGAPAMQHQI